MIPLQLSWFLFSSPQSRSLGKNRCSTDRLSRIWNTEAQLPPLVCVITVPRTGSAMVLLPGCIASYQLPKRASSCKTNLQHLLLLLISTVAPSFHHPRPQKLVCPAQYQSGSL